MTPYNPTEYNPQAMALNGLIKEHNRSIYFMLSKKGKAMYFPKYGILKQGAAAKGKDINATVGMATDEDGSPLCLRTMTDLVQMSSSEMFIYAPSHGVTELRKEWRDLIYKKNPSLKTEVSMPIVTSGLTHGLSRCAYTFFDPEDEVIIPHPFWGNYNLVFANEHFTKITTTPFFSGKKLDLEGIKYQLNDLGEKKGLLLNFPNNPSGYTPSEQEIDDLVQIIGGAADRGKKLIVLIDDAYFGLVFKDDIYKESIFTKLADFHENVMAVKIDGATKEDYAWGLRVGFLTFGIKGATKEIYEAIEDKIAGSLRGNISNVPMLSQSLVLKSLRSENYAAEKLEKFNILKKRFDKVEEILEKREDYKQFFTPLPFNSGYFMCIKLHDLSSEEVRQVLLKDYSTGIIAIEGDIIRIAFSATPLKLIEKLFENIFNACKDLTEKEKVAE
ncbi:aminotransferase class I/II-fold pyridoxal phosphate-dependent enzyme [bacterium]|nr:aminotransferase class I/II-fold pyridoxal phosphate-dependent enzyme [bacterium]